MRFNNELIAFKNVISFLENHNQAKEYSNEIANLKMHIKEELIPFMSSPDIKKLWKDVYFDKNRRSEQSRCNKN